MADHPDWALHINSSFPAMYVQNDLFCAGLSLAVQAIPDAVTIATLRESCGSSGYGLTSGLPVE
jgi:hypothetical protein